MALVVLDDDRSVRAVSAVFGCTWNTTAFGAAVRPGTPDSGSRSDRAYVLFGDRVVPSGLEQDPGFGRIFGTGRDLDRLIDWCATVRVDVMPPI